MPSAMSLGRDNRIARRTDLFDATPRSERCCGIGVRCRRRLHRTVMVVRSEWYAVSCGYQVSWLASLLGPAWPETSERITS
jgi:hypothetical protein